MKMLVLLGLIAPSLALAQVNTEKLRLTPDGEGLTGSVALSLTSGTGNVGKLDTSTSAGVASRWGDNLAFAVATSQYAAKEKREDRLADYTSGEERSILHSDHRYAHKHLLAARYNRFFSERFIGEIFAQAEYNQFLLLDLRALGGLGGRLVLFSEEAADGCLGVGYMAEYEQLDTDAIAEEEEAAILAHRLTAYLTFTLNLSDELSLVSTTYAQPRLTELVDLRVYNESSLSLPITESLAWSLAFTLRHDTQPPALWVDEGESVPASELELKPTDTSVVNRISITW